MSTHVVHTNDLLSTMNAHADPTRYVLSTLSNQASPQGLVSTMSTHSVRT